MGKVKTRSPLTKPNLKQPGSSIDLKILELAFKQTIPFTIVGVMLGATLFAWSEQLQWLSIGPWLASFGLILSFIYFYYSFERTLRDVRRYALGRNGEIMVGQLLEGLRPYGYTPIHDIPCKGINGAYFNIDHVLVGPKGIFVIETKTWSKKNGENEKITFKENVLFAGRRKCSDTEIHQAKYNAHWLQNLLETRSGKHYSVQPILTFPGWFVDSEATRAIRLKYGVHTLSAKQIGPYLGRYFEYTLSDEDIQHVTKVLAGYVYEKIENED